MDTLVKILHVMVCIFLMLTVLLQAGKGGGMGAAFGGGTSMGTVFGGSGAGNFLRKLTVIAAAVFMLTSMTLAWMSTPSTDPLEQYWAQQQKASLERDRAHMQALEGGEATPEDGATNDGDDGAGATDGDDGLTDDGLTDDGDMTEGEGAEGATEGEGDAEGATVAPGAGAEPAMKSPPPADSREKIDQDAEGGFEQVEEKPKQRGGITAPPPEQQDPTSGTTGPSTPGTP